MFRISGLVFPFLFFAVGLQAQSGSKAEFQIEWGPELPLSGDYQPIGFVGNLEHGLIRMSEQVKKDVAFERLGTDLTSTGELKHEWLPPSPNVMVERVLEVDGKTFVVVSDYDGKADSEKMLLYEVDGLNGGFKGPAKELIKTTGKVKGRLTYTGTIRYSTTDKFKVDVLTGGAHKVAYYFPKRDRKTDLKANEEVVYTLFDGDWKPLWSQEVTLPYPEAAITPLVHRVVNNEILLFAGIRSDSRQEGYDHIAVFRIRQGGDMREVHLNTEGNVVFDMMAGESWGKHLFLTGYTGVDALTPYRTGFFTALFNTETFELDDVSLYPLDADLMAASTNGVFGTFIENVPESQRSGVPYLKLRNMLPRPGGGWFVIGEQFSTYSEYVSNQNGSAIIEHLLYQDIWVTALDEEMGVQFSQRIPKKQESRVVYGSNLYKGIGAMMGGFSAFTYENDLYLFYLDLLENRKLENPNLASEFKSPKDAGLICTKIGADGTVSETVVHEIEPHYLRKLILPRGMKELEPGVWASTGLFFRESYHPAIIRLKD